MFGTLVICIVGLACSPAPQGAALDFHVHTIAVGTTKTSFDTAISLWLAVPVLTVSQGVYRDSFE